VQQRDIPFQKQNANIVQARANSGTWIKRGLRRKRRQNAARFFAVYLLRGGELDSEARDNSHRWRVRNPRNTTGELRTDRPEAMPDRMRLDAHGS
jgi:hypothetical protein